MEDAILLRSEAELAINEARRQKSERTKALGLPIQLAGKALDVHIEGNEAWIAENTHVAKRIDLERQSGRTLQTFKGHTAPVTCLAFFKSAAGRVLITGSWDKTIKLWDTDTRALLGSTAAHDDFVKCLFVFPVARLVVSTSSDKTVRFWDLASVFEGTLAAAGSLSAHSRPVECLAGVARAATSVTLMSADTMGVIKIWNLEWESGRWRSDLQETLSYHRTRVTEIVYGSGQIWTASSDETVQVASYPPDQTRPIAPLGHPLPVRAVLPLALTPLAEPYVVSAYGDVIRLYDLSTPYEPEVVGEIDAHWHDVMALRLWMRTCKNKAGETHVEPWIVSASLDGTLRKWRLSGKYGPCAHNLIAEPPPELATSTPEVPAVTAPVPEPTGNAATRELTEEEERELAELMGDD